MNILSNGLTITLYQRDIDYSLYPHSYQAAIEYALKKAQTIIDLIKNILLPIRVLSWGAPGASGQKRENRADTNLNILIGWA
jgi:hypothetical protein